VGIGKCLQTTSATTLSAGSSQVVQLTAADVAKLVVGQLINFANGTGAAEDVIVTAVDRTNNTMTAFFVNAHSGAYSIVTGRAASVGGLRVNTPGTSAPLPLSNGSPDVLPAITAPAYGIIAVIPLAGTGGTVPPIPFDSRCDFGLFYTLTGSGMDLSIGY